MSELQNSSKVAVVTGAARGIGLATSQVLATEGYFVYLADVLYKDAQAQALQLTESGLHAQAVELDVTKDDQWESLANEIAVLHGRVDAVVNNAFTITAVAAHETSPSDWTRQLEVCLSQIYRSVRYLHDLLQSGHNPTMVNISSVHAHLTESGHAAYAAAKGGVEALTRQLAIEYGPWLRVNAVAPGAIMTSAWAGVSDEVLRRVADLTPAKRIGEPEDIARVVRFLLSDDAAFVTGATVVVDGGWSINKVAL
jgi:NAD(P)-dependent dehydrogenase (short-subunit alcohol dehydrogenase family)